MLYFLCLAGPLLTGAMPAEIARGRSLGLRTCAPARSCPGPARETLNGEACLRSHMHARAVVLLAHRTCAELRHPGRAGYSWRLRADYSAAGGPATHKSPCATHNPQLNATRTQCARITVGRRRRFYKLQLRVPRGCRSPSGTYIQENNDDRPE